MSEYTMRAYGRMLKSAISSLRSLPERWKEIDPSVRKKRILIFLLIILHILPLWIFKYFPTQDGPAHVYNSYILRAFHDEESTLLREYYSLNLTLFPNWISHVCMSLLMYVFPPLIAEKIVLSAIISLFPLSLFYFLDSVNKGKSLYGFLGFLFSDHYLLHMGFYSFAFSVPLFFFAVGYFMKHKEDMKFSRIGILNLLCILTYFSHLLSYILLMLSLTLLSITSFCRRPKRVAWLLVCMLPLYFIMANYLLSNVVGHEDGGHLDLRWERFSDWKAWDYFLSTKSLMSFTDAHLIPTRIMSLMLGLLFIVTLYKRVRQRKIISRNDQFLLIFGVFTVLYFIMPWEMASGAWINDRVNLFMFPVLLPFLSEDYHKYIKRGIIVVMIILSIARLSISCRYYYPMDKTMKEYTSGVELIEKNKVVLGIASNASPNVKETPSFTHPEYVEPFGHAINYYCVNNGCVSLSNYEAKYNYFPLDWRIKHSGAIDYIVAWKLDKAAPFACGDDIMRSHGLDVQKITDSLDTDYDLIHSTENLQVYRHRAEQSD